VATAGGALIAAGLAAFLLLSRSGRPPELTVPAAERSAGTAPAIAPIGAPSAPVGAGEKVLVVTPPPLAVKNAADDEAGVAPGAAQKKEEVPGRAATDGGVARIREPAVRTQNVERGTVKKIRKKVPDRKRNEDIF
jgi:hypothetical protein